MLQEYSGHTQSVQSLRVVPYSFSLDGDEWGANSTFLSGSYDDKVILWDVRSSSKLQQYLIGDWVNAVEVLPDSSFLAGTSDNNIRLFLFKGTTTSKTFSGHTGIVKCVRYLGDGTFLSGSEDKSIMRWDIQSGDKMMTYTGHTDDVNTLEVIVDGTFLSGSWDKTVKRWSVTSPSAMETYNVGYYVYALVVVDDTNFLVGGDKVIMGFKIGTPNPVFQYNQVHTSTISSLLLVGNVIISSGDDGVSYRWVLGRKDPLTKFTHGRSIWSSSNIGDGTFVTGGGDQIIKRFTLDGKKSISPYSILLSCFPSKSLVISLPNS